MKRLFYKYVGSEWWSIDNIEWGLKSSFIEEKENKWVVLNEYRGGGY